MASSAENAAARATPPPAQLAAFYKLVDKNEVAIATCRYAHISELSAEAAVQAEALFDDDSLVVASLRMTESDSLTGLSVAAKVAEAKALQRRSWAVLLSVINLLLRRLEANTLLPGTIREEEMDFSAYEQVAGRKARHELPVPLPAVLRACVSAMGYNTLLQALFRSLDLLRHPAWTQHERKMVESFVLQGLDVIPRTAGVPGEHVAGENRVVSIIEGIMNPRNSDPAFCIAVLRKWRSDAVSSVLRARGALQTGVADYAQTKVEYEARQRADLAKHGLRDCALPSCSKTEKSVKECAGCSGCLSVVYCCLEHQALDWRAHKKACKEKEAARLAGKEAEDRTGGGAAV